MCFAKKSNMPYFLVGLRSKNALKNEPLHCLQDCLISNFLFYPSFYQPSRFSCNSSHSFAKNNGFPAGSVYTQHPLANLSFKRTDCFRERPPVLSYFILTFVRSGREGLGSTLFPFPKPNRINVGIAHKI